MTNYDEQYSEISKSLSIIEKELRNTKIQMVRISYNKTKNKPAKVIMQYGVLEKLLHASIPNKHAIDEAIETLECYLIPANI